ncbi:MAG: hypothetical protein HY964_09100 [Ignavibacteriales bacterium]|nr:hypothetical protein [Ignavibacteriales bacterium]
MLFLYPYTLQYNYQDSSYSESNLGIGGGRYSYEDCSGVHTQGFGDVGQSFSHKFNSPVRLGVRSSFGSYFLIVPELGLEWKYFSVGTTGVRVGSTDAYYLDAGILNQIPFASGKGLVNLGIGYGNIKPFSRLWLGMNAIPYSNVGILIQPEFPLGENKYFFINGRYGSFKGRAEYGLSFGVRFQYR